MIMLITAMVTRVIMDYFSFVLVVKNSTSGRKKCKKVVKSNEIVIDFFKSDCAQE